MKDYTILLTAVVGSTVHGIAVEDGLEDLDLMSIVVDGPRERLRLGADFQPTWHERTAAEGERSKAGDIDHVCHTLRHWVTLALQGNISTLVPLYAPHSQLRLLSGSGLVLRVLRNHFLSKRIYTRVRGYMHSNLTKVLNGTGRPELVQQFGYDTKAAAHMVRLSYQGAELLLAGTLSLPMPEELRRPVVDVRRGKYSLGEVTELLREADERLIEANEKSPLPESPNTDFVEKKMLDIYFHAWGLQP